MRPRRTTTKYGDVGALLEVSIRVQTEPEQALFDDHVAVAEGVVVETGALEALPLLAVVP